MKLIFILIRTNLQVMLLDMIFFRMTPAFSDFPVHYLLGYWECVKYPFSVLLLEPFLPLLEVLVFAQS